MDSDQGKLFIGGISWETSEEKLKDHFGRYGEVQQVVVMRDKLTSRPRGFAFVAFADPSVLDRVLADQHTIDGRTVEAKRALSRNEQHTSAGPGNAGMGRTFGGGGGGGGNTRTKKIFVGGLPADISEDGFRQYFEMYGTVTDTVVMYDAQTQRPRGFGFVSFDSEDSVDKVLHKTFHELNGKLVEVKRALPRDASSGNTGGRSMGGGGAYQAFGGSGANTGSYERTDASRYVQPQSGGGGAYPTYGSAGYGAPSYGYGPANNGAGGYGSYGVGGYGAAAGGGYSGPVGAYGNPNAAASGYASGQPGAPRSPWNGGSTAYGAAGSWNAPGGGSAVAPPTGQSPGAAAGYGSQGYGYGAREGSYGGQGGYGNAGGRSSMGPDTPGGGTGEQGAGPGYMGGGYGDAGSGYPASWRSDPAQGGGYGAGQMYGGGYGGPQARQT